MSKGWQHFTSWWVYPAGLAVFVILLVAPAFGVPQFWDELVLRLFILMFVSSARTIGEFVRRGG